MQGLNAVADPARARSPSRRAPTPAQYRYAIASCALVAPGASNSGRRCVRVKPARPHGRFSARAGTVHAAGESFEPYENQRKRELAIRRAHKPRHGCERASARVDECRIRMGMKKDRRGERTYGTQPRSQATRARAWRRGAWGHPPHDTHSPTTRPALPAVPSPLDFAMTRHHPREDNAGSRPVQ
jgi:hypothetical protein